MKLIYFSKHLEVKFTKKINIHFSSDNINYSETKRICFYLKNSNLFESLFFLTKLLLRETSLHNNHIDGKKRIQLSNFCYYSLVRI